MRLAAAIKGQIDRIEMLAKEARDCPARSVEAIRAKLAEQVTALRALGGMAAANLAELEGYQKLLDGDVGAAFDLFAKASGMRPEALSA